MPYIIRYTIKLPDNVKKQYTVELDDKTGHLIPKTSKNPPPEWTRLKYQKCPNCTLKDGDEAYCPIAVNVSNLVEDFKEMLSHTDVTCVVEVPERGYVRKTDLQTSLQSIFGMIMATSGCPVMDYFRPMARFHLPFASVEEHMIRSTGYHLIKELLKFRKGEAASFDLVVLQKQYEQVSIVNVHFSKRIANVTTRDSGKNAMIGLHTVGEMIGMEINSSLDTIEEFFR